MARPSITSESIGPFVVKQALAEEVVVAELGGVTTTPDTPNVRFDVTVPLETALESTNVEVRIRRDGIAGHEVARLSVHPTVATLQEVALQASDQPGEVVDQKYVVTVKPAVAKEVIVKEARIRAQY